MTDLASLYNADLIAADLNLAGGLLAEDGGLETAVIISLFTDRRARPDDELPDAGGSKRGWWGDMVPATVGGEPVDDDRIGSRLWLLGREKQMPVVLVRAKEYATEALQWLIEDGIAARVEVETSVPRTGVLGIAVTIHRPEGDAISFRYDNAWSQQAQRTP